MFALRARRALRTCASLHTLPCRSGLPTVAADCVYGVCTTSTFCTSRSTSVSILPRRARTPGTFLATLYSLRVRVCFPFRRLVRHRLFARAVWLTPRCLVSTADDCRFIIPRVRCRLPGTTTPFCNLTLALFSTRRCVAASTFVRFWRWRLPPRYASLANTFLPCLHIPFTLVFVPVTWTLPLLRLPSFDALLIPRVPRHPCFHRRRSGRFYAAFTFIYACCVVPFYR